MPKAKKVAFLLADGFEDSEMKNPFDELVKNGHETVIIGLHAGEKLEGKRGTIAYQTHLSIAEANTGDYDAVVIPGGRSPGKLKDDERIQHFVQEANEKGIVIAAICHGPQVLAEAGLLEGRTLTAYPELALEIDRSGGRFLDQSVVVDQNWITSRTPEDEPDFIGEIVKKIGVNAW
ncbi:type 1 glutamine amidotransferase domain-containing protein [Paenibacillus sp. GCM10027627]|uniref:type 1 glutamine amidotransferase domain-containing protein n=1 Tax=unclassified Paenibacillus TaxID=185978 RepID=UPI003639F90D